MIGENIWMNSAVMPKFGEQITFNIKISWRKHLAEDGEPLAGLVQEACEWVGDWI